MEGVTISKGYDIQNSYAFDISEYMRKQNNCGNCIIAFVRKETEKAILLEELFGYRRKMWFPKTHIQLTPQKGCSEILAKVGSCMKCELYEKCGFIIAGYRLPNEQLEQIANRVISDSIEGVKK